MSLFRPEPTLTDLPDEILVHILSYLDLSLPSDVFNISSTCVRLKNIAGDQRFIKRLNIRMDPKFTKETLSFFTDPSISDKIQEVDIQGVRWIKAWQLVKKLPSLTRISFTAFRRCLHGDPKDLINMAKVEMAPYLKKLTHVKLVFDEEENFDKRQSPYYATTRYLIQMLCSCENLQCLEIIARSVDWVDVEGFPVRGVKLPKLKHFVIQNRLKPTMVGDVEYNFFEMMLITNVQTMGIRTCDLKKIETWKNLNSF